MVDGEAKGQQVLQVRVLARLRLSLQDLSARAVLTHEARHHVVGNGGVLDEAGSLGRFLAAVHKYQHLGTGGVEGSMMTANAMA